MPVGSYSTFQLSGSWASIRDSILNSWVSGESWIWTGDLDDTDNSVSSLFSGETTFKSCSAEKFPFLKLYVKIYNSYLETVKKKK